MKVPVFLLSAVADQPLIEELWEYFADTYVNSDKVYENIEFGGFFSAQTLIIGIFVGLAIAAIASVIGKQINGAFVTRLIDRDCLSPESAKTLSELDAAHILSVRFGLARGVNLRRVVRCREEEEYLLMLDQKEAEYAKMREENPKLPKKFTPKPFRVDPDRHHFYIPEDMKYMAQVKFERKGNSIWSALIWSAVILVALVAVILFLPSFLSLLDTVIGSF